MILVFMKSMITEWMCIDKKIFFSIKMSFDVEARKKYVCELVPLPQVIQSLITFYMGNDVGYAYRVKVPPRCKDVLGIVGTDIFWVRDMMLLCNDKRELMCNDKQEGFYVDGDIQHIIGLDSYLVIDTYTTIQIWDRSTKKIIFQTSGYDAVIYHDHLYYIDSTLNCVCCYEPKQNTLHPVPNTANVKFIKCLHDTMLFSCPLGYYRLHNETTYCNGGALGVLQTPNDYYRVCNDGIRSTTKQYKLDDCYRAIANDRYMFVASFMGPGHVLDLQSQTLMEVSSSLFVTGNTIYSLNRRTHTCNIFLL